MTLLAGMYAFASSIPIALPQSAKSAIVAELSRTGAGVETAECVGFLVAKIDIGAFSKAPLRRGPILAGIAGEPYYAPNEVQISRKDQQDVLSDSMFSSSSLVVLRECSGLYSLVSYDKHTHCLKLVTDRFGARPMYWFQDDQYLVFSSALRVLERLPIVDNQMDVGAFLQQATMGTCLGNRTVYRDIQVLRGGEILTARESRVVSERYSRWDNASRRDYSKKHTLGEAYERFSQAVGLRGDREHTSISLLSGGLDSRCVATLLRSQDRDTHTVTFETRGRIDHTFALRFAKELQVPNALLPAPRTRPVLSAVGELAESLRRGSGLARCSRRVFSGDGGSVGVGFVYVKGDLVDALRREDLHAAASILLEGRVPRRAFHRQVYQELYSGFHDAIVDELSDIASDDPVRVAHLFFMNNDQRTHLHAFFEDVDLYGIEIEVPFMDGPFMEYLMSLPASIFLQHQFYHDWVRFFPSVFLTVPWQTYPGHLRCPIQDSGPAGIDQWQVRRSDKFLSSAPMLRRSFGMFLGGRFAHDLLSLRHLLASYAVHGLAIKPMEHVFAMHVGIQLYRDRQGGRT